MGLCYLLIFLIRNKGTEGSLPQITFGCLWWSTDLSSVLVLNYCNYWVVLIFLGAAQMISLYGTRISFGSSLKNAVDLDGRLFGSVNVHCWKLQSPRAFSQPFSLHLLCNADSP